MHNMADFQAHRQHRNEMAREVEEYRMGRQWQAARPSKNPLARLAVRLGLRASGAFQPAG